MRPLPESDEIDLFVGPSVLTDEARQLISDALAAYHATHPRIEQTSIEAAYQAHVAATEAAASVR